MFWSKAKFASMDNNVFASDKFDSIVDEMKNVGLV